MTRLAHDDIWLIPQAKTAFSFVGTLPLVVLAAYDEIGIEIVDTAYARQAVVFGAPVSGIAAVADDVYFSFATEHAIGRFKLLAASGFAVQASYTLDNPVNVDGSARLVLPSGRITLES